MQFRDKYLLVGISSLALMHPIAVQAQNPAPQGAAAPADEEDKDAIIVTGSRIARAQFDTVEPSVLVSSDQIEQRGFPTLGDALNEQPAFGVPGASRAGLQSAFGQGQSFVNFLGLGSQRTLTLVNGRRFVSSNTPSILGPTGTAGAGSQVDLNVIPTKLIDRVETIAVGGAPIYGSDAIAGTVNIVLRKDYQGIELDGQYGLSSRGDAAEYRVRGLAGYNFGDGRGNITVAGEYSQSEGLTGSDRSFFAQNLFFAKPQSGNTGFLQQLYSDQRFQVLSESGIPVVGGAFLGFDIPLSPEMELLVVGAPGFNFGVQGANGGPVRFDDDGNLIPIDFGAYASPPTAVNVTASGGNGFSLVPTLNLLSETRRYSGIVTTKYELTDSIHFFGEAWYSNSRGRNLRGQPEYNTALFGAAGSPTGSVIMSVNNPYLSPAARTAIQTAIATNPLSDQNLLGAPQDYFYLARANTDLSTGASSGEVEVMRFVAGFEGGFDMGPGRWNWEIVGNYGRSKSTNIARQLVQQNFLNAVDAVDQGAFGGGAPNGNIICRPGSANASIATISSTCAPLNLFGVGQSQAALDYISALSQSTSINKQKMFSASIAGPVAALPGGNLSIALSYEHREESQSFDPGAYFRGERQVDGDNDPSNDVYLPYGRSAVVDPIAGKFNTDEIAGEIRAELISPSTNSFINLLELKVAGRWVDHSIAGSDFTWTAGGRLKPVEDLTIRGNFTRSIRSPAITEIFNPTSSFQGFAVDPCDQVNRGNGPAPATRDANCLAEGLPANFASTSELISFNQTLTGNRQLANEKADSWTIGLLLEPRFVPGFRASVDYIDIKLKDAISPLTGTQILASCYDSADFPDNPFCDLIERSPTTGQVTLVDTGYVNQASLRYKGILVDVGYRIPTPSLAAEGSVGLSLGYQYLDELTTRADSSSQKTQVDGSIGYSKHKGVLTLNYAQPEFNFFTQLNYIGKAKIDPQAVPNFYPDGLNNIPSVVFVNMGVNFNVGRQFAFRLNVDNVFDKQPPRPYPAYDTFVNTRGSVTYFQGLLGRFFRAGATVKF